MNEGGEALREDKYEILKRFYGLDSFRPGQAELIDAILAGRDCLGIMPTGGGKSLCYQVPALMLPGLALVVSPLISLMADQVGALRANGIGAEFLNSSLESDEYAAVMRRIRSGRCKLLYIAPERLESAPFINFLSGLDISLIAVDEAHCVSQWGQDFRPSYLKISAAASALPAKTPMAAFTATATNRVQRDIVELLGLREPFRVVTGFDRPNLYFDVRYPADKDAELLRLISERPGKSGIVYCSTRSAVEKVCELLRSHGLRAVRYHAGLSDAERAGAQEAFQYDEADIMAATNAFGMGIDKSNVSYVIHYNMPLSLDAYYQEAGRAGRDGSPADCILLYSKKDVVTAKYLLEHSENGLGEADIYRLRQMEGYCRSSRCLRGYILGYFGESHQESCGNCGNCSGERRYSDITLEAQQILSCVLRIKKRLGHCIGRAKLCAVLRGEDDESIAGLRGLSTFGLMEGESARRINEYIDSLIDSGYAYINEFQAVCASEKAAGVLFNGERVRMIERRESVRLRGAKAELELAPGAKGHSTAALYERLRAKRARMARASHVPAYVIFSNATLENIAAAAPESMEEFLAVSGVGQVKAARYGRPLLAEIRAFLDGE